MPLSSNAIDCKASSVLILRLCLLATYAACYRVAIAVLHGIKRMKTLSLKLPAPLHHELETTAKRKGRSKSAVLRTALEQYLHGDQSAEANSFLEKAADVIGSVRG